MCWIETRVSKLSLFTRRSHSSFIISHSSFIFEPLDFLGFKFGKYLRKKWRFLNPETVHTTKIPEFILAILISREFSPPCGRAYYLSFIWPSYTLLLFKDWPTHLVAILKHGFVHHVRVCRFQENVKCMVESKMTHSYHVAMLILRCHLGVIQCNRYPFHDDDDITFVLYTFLTKQFSSARNLNQVMRYLFRFKYSVKKAASIPCKKCKTKPPEDATKSCLDCKLSYCNECFANCHPWGTPRAQHEYIGPTNHFRPKVSRVALRTITYFSFFFFFFFFYTCMT